MHPLDDLLRLVGFLIGAIPIGFAPPTGQSTRCRVNCGDKCRPYRAAGGPATRREGRYLKLAPIGGCFRCVRHVGAEAQPRLRQDGSGSQLVAEALGL